MVEKEIKKTITVPQNKPNKLLNRVFAGFFFVYLLAYLIYYIGYTEYSPMKPMVDLIGPLAMVILHALSPLGLGLTIILYGLLMEIWRPSLDFTISHERRLTILSAVLFTVLIVLSVWWWVAHGIPNWLPNQGLQAAFIGWFTGVFIVDTSILSLMLGILFLTNSTPKKSPSYKIMLIGVVFYQVVCTILYVVQTIVNLAGSHMALQVERYTDFLGYTIFQPWFWCDLTYLIVTLAGALLLLRETSNIKRMILIITAVCIAFFILGGVAAFMKPPS